MDTQNNITEGVKNLLGEPKRAILKLSTPMIIAMLVNAFYNIADGFWVAGLGADALASVGLFFPFFFIIIALGMGIGIGGSSAISRRIGANDKKEADNTAEHTLILGFVVSVIISVSAFPFLEEIMKIFSGENMKVAVMAINYSKIFFLGTPILIFSNIASSILRGEGDAKRAMYGILLGSILNIILDPLFIYTFKLGVNGAAVASVLSMAVSSLLFVYWMFSKKDTYLDISIQNFKYNRKILGEILSVGIPSTLAQLSMSISMIILNKIVVFVGNTDGIAVFTSGWRIVMIATTPILGLATGVIAVTGAAYGAKNKEKLKTAYLYSIKFGILLEILIALLVFLFTEEISHIFTYSKGAARISEDLISFLKITTIFYLAVPPGILTSAMFRGIDKGFNSLIVTLIRTFVFQIPLAYILGAYLDFGLTGVWWGIVGGNLIATVFTFTWGLKTVNHIPFNTQ
jgi:putative MATE family efflux protein